MIHVSEIVAQFARFVFCHAPACQVPFVKDGANSKHASQEKLSEPSAQSWLEVAFGRGQFDKIKVHDVLAASSLSSKDSVDLAK